MENMETDSGVTGRELAIEIYSNHKLAFITTQVGVFLNEYANFTQGSRKP